MHEGGRDRLGRKPGMHLRPSELSDPLLKNVDNGFHCCKSQANEKSSSIGSVNVVRFPLVHLLSGGLTFLLVSCSSGGGQSTDTLRSVCGKPETYAALKSIVFEEARKRFDGDVRFINSFEQGFTVNIEAPVPISISEDIQRVECQGRMILGVPAANYEEFGRDKALVQDVTYSAQAASNGSGFVYELGGFTTALERILIAASSIGEREQAAINRQLEELEKAQGRSSPKKTPVPDEDYSGNLIN